MQLNCHYKSVSAKNIIILFVSWEYFTLLIWGWKTPNMDYIQYIYICVCVCVCVCVKNYKNFNSQATVKGIKQ